MPPRPVYTYTATPAVPGVFPSNLNIKREKSSTSLFVWSLILFFLFNIVGTPLAAVAAIYAAMANARDAQDRETKRTKSKVLCIVATCVDALTLLFFIALLIWKYRFNHGLFLS